MLETANKHSATLTDQRRQDSTLLTKTFFALIMVGGVDVVVTSAADQNFYLHLYF